MKIGKIGSTIQTLTQPLQDLGATEAATSLNYLSALFDELKNEEVKEFAKTADRLELAPRTTEIPLGDIAKSIIAMIAVAKVLGAKKVCIDALNTTLACIPVNRLAHIGFEDFASAMKAGLKVDVVALHLNALEENLGKSSFDIVYAAMEKDRRVKAVEAAAIASKFVSQTSPSAPKRKSLQRIYARHLSLLDSENKREWQKGKSAA